MLILQRKTDQSLVIGDQITITVIDVGPDSVKLAIDAPKEITILRSELVEAAAENREASVSLNEHALEELKNFLVVQQTDGAKKESQE